MDKDSASGFASKKGEQTRRMLRDAAVARFGRDGFKATSVAEIARDADVGGSVPYRYFPDKKALFLAALDHDAEAVIEEGVATIIRGERREDWHTTLMPALLGAVERHPLARRVLAGLEPGATGRMRDLPALSELRRAVAARLREQQADGNVRGDIDPARIAEGAVGIWLSLLMSVVQFGSEGMAVLEDGIRALFDAALDPAPGPAPAPDSS